MGSGAFFKVYQSGEDRCRKDLWQFEDYEAQRGAVTEAAILARLGYPTTISGLPGKIRSIAVPLVDGLSYENLLDEPADKYHAKWLLGKFAQATAKILSRSHSHGITANDVKPENVYFLSEGKNQIVDWSNGAIHPLSSAWRKNEQFAFGNPNRIDRLYNHAENIFPTLLKLDSLKISQQKAIMELLHDGCLPLPISYNKASSLLQKIIGNRWSSDVRNIRDILGLTTVDALIHEASPKEVDVAFLTFTRKPDKKTVTTARNELMRIINENQVLKKVSALVSPMNEIEDGQYISERLRICLAFQSYPVNGYIIFLLRGSGQLSSLFKNSSIKARSFQKQYMIFRSK